MAIICYRALARGGGLAMMAPSDQPILADDLDSRLASVLSEWAQATLQKAVADAAGARAEAEAMRKERDEAVRIAGLLRDLRDAVVRWHKDSYSPRLRNAIDVFLRQEIARR